MALFVELSKALAWPLLWLFIVVFFRREIRSLLREMPSMVRRMRSAQGLGLQIELDKIGDELPEAELRASSLSIPMPSLPLPTGMEGGKENAES